MLYYDIKRLLALRGIERPRTFLMKNGFGSQTADNFMKNKVLYIKPQMIEKLCVLLNCTPNELFSWKPDAEPAPENHPLKPLYRDKPAKSIAQLVRDVPAEKLGRLEELINELKNEE